VYVLMPIKLSMKNIYLLIQQELKDFISTN
jgi:hypothetical protein